ncbi:hypothetical protein DFH08DRAFT_972270 [Mycena albidolilacea]|uniref:Heme haloperoxidase family profile domain-containing protein n=1 Tax=Mycena albidolilacea TaxID=1033008 RepID=A0AAD6ZBJ5_9AGAR|nr:hypothetical protein DFH08DRAFT_972270 [Mycena albidolilacea]
MQLQFSFVLASLLFFAAAAAHPNNAEPKGHEWKAPGPGDVRGPCPGLNTLANHRYLPHNGKQFTVKTLLDAGVAGFNVDPVPIAVAAKFGIMTTDLGALSEFTETELLSAMGAFQLPVPAIYTVPSLRSLVKAHLNANPDLMRQPDYSALFTKRVRDTYLAQKCLDPLHSGSCLDFSELMPRVSRSELMSRFLLPTALSRASASKISISFMLLTPVPRSPSLPVDTADIALAANKRPERQLGLTATNAAHLVPEATRKRFAQGWKQHVPLHFLTDSYCSYDNTETAKELDDTYTLDGSRGVIAVSKTLPSEPELALKFGEWFQAWGRLLDLIKTYCPTELHLWHEHYERILNRPNKQDDGALCVAYDTEVRRRCCSSALDPSIFHLAIWNDLEPKHMAR